MSSPKHVESRDIMPCGHLSNGISCDYYETDRKEYGSDVMVLRKDLAIQRHSDKKLLMTGNEEALGLKPDQIAEQDIDSKPYIKRCKMMVDQHGCSKDKTETKSGQQNKDDKSLKEQKERTKNDRLLHFSNDKKQESVEKEKDIKHYQNQCKMMIDQHGCSKDKTETKLGQQNKGIKSLKGQTERKKNDTSLYISNNKKQTESVENEEEIKRGKQIFEKRKKGMEYQFTKDKRITGSVGQNREIRCRKRLGERKKNDDTAHNISIHKKQTGYNKDVIKSTKILRERKKNKTAYQILKDKKKTDSAEHNKAEKKNIQKRSKKNAIPFEKVFWVFRTYMHLCYLMVLLVVDSYESTQNGTWILNNTHVVFGESVVLRCTFDTNICKTGSTRRWTKGKFQTFLTNNGKSVKESKYKEVISSDCFTSYLIITDFNQDDMGVEYTFAYSTMEFSSELKLERSGYISYPKNETTTGEISCTKSNLSLNLKLFEINPVPHCSMVIKNETISTEGKTKNTSEFLSNSEYLFQYKLKQTHKQGKLYVRCNFETRNITVFDGWFNCDDPKDLEKEDDLTVKISAPLTVLSVILVIVLVFWYYDKWKKKKKETKNHYNEVRNGDVGNRK